MRKHRFLPIAIMLCICLGLSACGSQPAAPEDKPVTEPAGPVKEATENGPAKETTENEPVEAPSEGPAADQKDVLVVYFSATGTTRGVAEKIAKVTDADIYEIVPAEPYTSDDLNWHDNNSRTTHEQNDKSVRPAIGSETIDLSGYTTIYIGFPIWWGEEPRIMDTFAESYDFSGIRMIPFCTSGGSGIGRSGPNMEALAGTGTWLDGKRFSSGVSESELQSWIDGLQ